MERTPSPNHDSRDSAPIDTLVLHYTGMQSGAEALERLCDPAAQVSAHYLVEEDGRIFQLVDETQRAWHAGVASWRGHSNINARSIGIEIVNPGHEWGYRPFPEPQMQAVITLCQQILTRHPIPARNVIGHSDVAPARKQDPGELFDWARLAQAGIGLWITPKHAINMEQSCEPVGSPLQSPKASGLSRSTAVRSGNDNIPPPSSLATYGYNTDALEHSITAFQRHFRPTLVNGQWDEACESILANLLKQV